MTSRNPDAELHLMQRMWRDLEQLPVAGRRRLLVYLFARVDEIPEAGNGVDRGPQQLDIEDAVNAVHEKRARDLAGDLLLFKGEGTA